MVLSRLPYLIALLSGMCALVYEVLWMRTVIPVFGLSVYSTTAVLVSFMTGLGLGSYLAPRLIARWRRPIWGLYAWLEIAIGAGACVVPFSVGPITSIFVALAPYDQAGPVTMIVRLLLAMLVMILPTVAMGLTLPVLVHACQNDGDDQRYGARRIGLLYGLNTVGAALGCIVVGFVLLTIFGIRGATLATACLNWSLAVLVYLLFVRRPGAERVEELPAVDETQPAGDRPALPVWALLALYGVVGFVAFGMELVWFRILVFYLQSATYSFSIMLALYLLGIGAGSVAYARLFAKTIDAASSATVAKMLGLAQLGIAFFGISTLRVYTGLPDFWAGLIATLGARSWLMIVAQKAIVAGIIILPATFLMGLSFPLMARLYKAHGARDARAVGHLYATNTVGSVLGSLLTGFVLFNTLGVQSTLTLMAFLSLGVGILFSVSQWSVKSRMRTVAAAIVILFAFVLLTNPPRILINNFEKYVGKVLMYREYASDISFAFQARNGHRYVAFHDGRGTAGTELNGNHVNRFLAHSSMLLNPDAKHVLVISMGCGNTASAFTKFPIESLDIVDISEGPFEAAEYFHTNDGVLNDPRVRTYVEDGRNFLLRATKQYDIIELELPSIHTEGVVNLYTEEFYDIAYERLSPGGVLSQWIDAAQAEKEPSEMLINTMLQAFPHSTLWVSGWSWTVNGVKTDRDVVIDYDKTATLFASDAVVEDMRRVKATYEGTLAGLVSAGELLRAAVAGAELITDNETKVDFMVPKLNSPYAFGGGVAYFTAPMRHAFVDSWQRDGTVQATGWSSMFPFYDAADQQRLMDETIDTVTPGFPEAVRARVKEINDNWQGLRKGEIRNAKEPMPAVD